MSALPKTRSAIPGLAALTAAAVLIHGYHLGTDDAGIWVPAIKKAADPSLYPFGGEFFLTHARLSLFPWLMGSIVRLTHVPSDLVIFLCHLAGVFLLLLASWRLLAACFERDRARWAGVALLAGVLSVPVAGTALPIMDPYVTSRSLSTPFALMAVAGYIGGRKRGAVVWLAACALVHPQMSVYAAGLMGMMELARRRAAIKSSMAFAGWFPLALLPLPWALEPATGPAREALLSRTFFFVSDWAWYEWLGVAMPLLLLWAGTRIRLRGARPPLGGLLSSLVTFGLIFTGAGLLLVTSPRLENYARLQPMRAFHLIYIVFFLVGGALAGEYLLKDRRWRWLALFLPLSAGMWLAAREAFPNSRHLEWPWAAPRGEWVSAFMWVRHNTPKDAVFAMDPGYLLLPGEDMHGFRAVAERSSLADRVKDSGAVSLFPQLAESWDRQVRAESGPDGFLAGDLDRLSRQYPVTWIVTAHRGAGLDCPYRNPALAVCRISGAAPKPSGRGTP
jgi:hypothetical protein